MSRGAWVEISLQCIEHNVREVARLLAPGTKLMAVVKADGYGHGACSAARAALSAGASYLGVSLPQEGIKLRQDGVKAPILVLGALQPAQVDEALRYDLAVTVADLQAARALAGGARSRGKRAVVHVKLDTGMGRLGFLRDEAVACVVEVAGMPELHVEGVFTHLATADDPDQAFAKRQLEGFLAVMGELDKAGGRIPMRHAANSAATLWIPESRLDMVRTGIALYGLEPSRERPCGLDLRPALCFKAVVTAVRRLPAGSSVSYGAAYRTPRDTTIVTLPVGYADGFSRILSGKAEVLIRGRRFPVAGRICMDQLMVDVGECPVSIGEQAVLIGRQGEERITAEEVAQKLGTINYEVVSSIGPRVPRICHRLRDPDDL
ncbi:MAG: alanine racemase [Firmicutes bacterium]|nr:alanine racemase [Bacillota bacterium]